MIMILDREVGSIGTQNTQNAQIGTRGRQRITVGTGIGQSGKLWSRYASTTCEVVWGKGGISRRMR